MHIHDLRNSKCAPWLMAATTVVLLSVVGAPVFAAWNYAVNPGDSLWRSSQRFGTSVNALKQANGIADGGNQIKSGNNLVVPAADFPRDATAAATSQNTAAQAEAKPAKSTTQNGSAPRTKPAAPASRIRYTQGDLDMLARLVQAEAGGEPYAGQVAVAAVVINRMQSGRFPTTVSGVIYEQDAFECVSNGWFNNPPSATAYQAALDALHGWDPSGGALFYFAPAKTSSPYMWSLPQITWIGQHIFARG